MTLERRKTVAELMEADDYGAIELAAARAELRSASLLNDALRESGVSGKELAERLGVTEGRVSQVLGGYSNPRLTTLARYLRALGYETVIDATPATPSAPPLAPRRRTRESRSTRARVEPIDVYAVRMNSGAPAAIVLTPAGSMPSDLDLNGAWHVGTMSPPNGTARATSTAGRIQA